MKQDSYTKIVSRLDEAFQTFMDETRGDPLKAESAMRDFILNHYFMVWRAMSPERTRT